MSASFFCLSFRRWFPFVFRFVVVLSFGLLVSFCLSLWCWVLLVCRCGVWCVGLISAVARGNGLLASGNLSRSVVSCRRVGVEAMREFRRIMVDLHSGKMCVRVACFNGDDRNVLCCFFQKRSPGPSRRRRDVS